MPIQVQTRSETASKHLVDVAESIGQDVVVDDDAVVEVEDVAVVDGGDSWPAAPLEEGTAADAEAMPPFLGVFPEE